MRKKITLGPLRETDPILQAKAQTELDNLALGDDFEILGAQLRDLFEIRAPSLRQLTTPEELADLIEAIRQGTVDNRRLTRFLDIAHHIASVTGAF